MRRPTLGARALLATLAAVGVAPAPGRPAGRASRAGRVYASSTDRAYTLGRYRALLGAGPRRKHERRRLRRLVCHRGGY